MIAIIVMFFSRTDTKNLENQIRGLRAEVGEIKRLIEAQAGEIRQLSAKLSASSPRTAVERGIE